MRKDGTEVENKFERKRLGKKELRKEDIWKKKMEKREKIELEEYQIRKNDVKSRFLHHSFPLSFFLLHIFSQRERKKGKEGREKAHS